MRTRSALAVLVMLSLAAGGQADTLNLKDGSVLQGKFVGGTATDINFETSKGVITVVTTDIDTLKFGLSVPPTPPVPTPAPMAVPPTPAPAAAAAPASVPAGTVLTVRMDTQVSSKDDSGKKFSGKLVADVKADGVVIKAGTNVIGVVEKAKQAGRLAGKSELKMTLVSIDLGGTLVPIATTNFAETGKSSFRKTARNTAVGAVIGNQVEDDDGGDKGAAIGLGVSLIREGESVTVPPGAILEFRLSQPLNVKVSK